MFPSCKFANPKKINYVIYLLYYEISLFKFWIIMLSVVHINLENHQVFLLNPFSPKKWQKLVEISLAAKFLIHQMFFLKLSTENFGGFFVFFEKFDFFVRP